MVPIIFLLVENICDIDEKYFFDILYIIYHIIHI